MKRLLGVEASDLDFYLFDREARMDQVWASEPAGVVGEMGSDRIHSDNCTWPSHFGWIDHAAYHGR